MQQVETETDDTSSPGKCTLVLTGYIRAHSLSVNQLVIYSASVIILLEIMNAYALSEFFKIRFTLLEQGISHCLRLNFLRIHVP